MEILPINNINIRQAQFKAKFPKQDVKQFLTEIEDGDRSSVPELYTLLDFIKNLSGRTAKIISSKVRPFYQICIDGKSITNDREYICAYHALYDAAVIHKNSALTTSPLKRITEEEFETRFYKNTDKTIEDIEKMFE